MKRRNSFKTIRPFDESRESTERTDPDYLEKRTAQMAREVLTLKEPHLSTYWEGLERKDRDDLYELLGSFQTFRPISDLLDESRRCIEKAQAPHGSVAVTGKALDLLIKSFFPHLSGTLGKMLYALKRLKPSSTILSQIVDDLVEYIRFLEVRNAGAHFNSEKPEILLKEAQAFLDQAQSLLKYEKEQAKQIFLHLQRGSSQKKETNRPTRRYIQRPQPVVANLNR